MATSSSKGGLPPRRTRALSLRQPLLRLADALRIPERRSRQAIWPDRLKHMRVFPAGVRLTPDPSRGWGVEARGQVLGTTRGLDDAAGCSSGKVLIVASGPSARGIDYDVVPDSVALLAVNGSPEILKGGKRHADVYLATDPDFFRHRMEIVRQSVRTAGCSLLSYAGVGYLAVADPALLRECASRLSVLEPAGRYYLVPRLDQDALAAWSAGAGGSLTLGERGGDLAARVGWSADLRHGVFTGRTVAFTALQVAAFLGYREIGLVGADFSAGGRAYEEPDGARPSKIASDFDAVSKEAFTLARKCCEREGIRLCNLAPSSRLTEVLETVGAGEFFSDGSAS